LTIPVPGDSALLPAFVHGVAIGLKDGIGHASTENGREHAIAVDVRRLQSGGISQAASIAPASAAGSSPGSSARRRVEAFRNSPTRVADDRHGAAAAPERYKGRDSAREGTPGHVAKRKPASCGFGARQIRTRSVQPRSRAAFSRRLCLRPRRRSLPVKNVGGVFFVRLPAKRRARRLNKDIDALSAA